MRILLKVDDERNHTQAKITTAENGKWGFVSLQTASHYVELAGELRDLHELFTGLASGFRARSVADVINSITPEQVIAYFEASPVLSVHAADVRAVLEPMTGRGRGASQLQADVEALRPFQAELFVPQGGLARGYTRRAALILFGSEDANGGSNLSRIRAAVVELQKEFTTTTGQPGHNGPETLQKAA